MHFNVVAEFGQHGKGVITVEELVKHEAGESIAEGALSSRTLLGAGC
jgi:hypothetical protein